MLYLWTRPKTSNALNVVGWVFRSKRNICADSSVLVGFENHFVELDGQSHVKGVNILGKKHLINIPFQNSRIGNVTDKGDPFCLFPIQPPLSPLFPPPKYSLELDLWCYFILYASVYNKRGVRGPAQAWITFSSNSPSAAQHPKIRTLKERSTQIKIEKMTTRSKQELALLVPALTTATSRRSHTRKSTDSPIIRQGPANCTQDQMTSCFFWCEWQFRSRRQPNTMPCFLRERADEERRSFRS